MAKQRKLMPRQQRFVVEYLIDLNATAAAKRSGYSAKTARQAGAENLSKPVIAAEIAEGKARHAEEAGLSAIETLKQVMFVSTADIRSFFDEDDNLKPVSEWTEAQGALVASMEVIIKNAEAGDGHTDRVHKFKFWDKPKAINLAMQNLGLLIEKIEHSGDVSFTWQTSE